MAPLPAPIPEAAELDWAETARAEPPQPTETISEAAATPASPAVEELAERPVEPSPPVEPAMRPVEKDPVETQETEPPTGGRRRAGDCRGVSTRYPNLASRTAPGRKGGAEAVREEGRREKGCGEAKTAPNRKKPYAQVTGVAAKPAPSQAPKSGGARPAPRVSSPKWQSEVLACSTVTSAIRPAPGRATRPIG